MDILYEYLDKDIVQYVIQPYINPKFDLVIDDLNYIIKVYRNYSSEDILGHFRLHPYKYSRTRSKYVFDKSYKDLIHLLHLMK